MTIQRGVDRTGGNPLSGGRPTLRASAQPPSPAVALAVVGVLIFAFMIFVLGRWVTGENFTSTPTGPDPLPSGERAMLIGLQIAVPLGAAVCLWFWVGRQWRRDRRLNTTSMFVLSGAMLFFWDMSMNYTSVSLFYNSHLLNRGAWANDAWPGWTSPNGNLLPEPLLIVPPAYTCLVFIQVMAMLWLLRKARERWPELGFYRTFAIIIVGLTIFDTVIEGAVLRTGVYAYPGGIREVTLWAGETYQIPMTETFFFGGLGLGAITALMHFRNDKGQTIAERGIDRLSVSERQRQWVRFFAIFGAVHLSFFVVYTVPNQWLSTHSDPHPANYPSYLENGMCASGADQDECPGPGVPMPRPASNP
ncbi:spirocyclase AveC family protein [Nocardioides sp. WS12]|uniref:spirocyclase AveC family protein n=1 Tax=Nocardioides sp. WS12 TaxID=2486272 RepID=UPI0015F8B7A1|nr:spirocyclase AveC family protein [Nocardioides sp. WS12]